MQSNPPPVSSIHLRPAAARGHVSMGWLDTWHSFSFGDYYDPKNMGFRNLRVINDDRVAAGRGFPTHPHQDMEILTYVLAGALTHKDSLGTGSTILPGDVQRMSAGTGIRHSEANPSAAEPLHLLQIWILPTHRGVAPGYEQKHFEDVQKRGRLALVLSPDGAEGSVRASADARLFATLLAPGEQVTHLAPAGRHTYVHVARGRALVAGQLLGPGDAATTDGPAIVLEGQPGEVMAEVLVFDLP